MLSLPWLTVALSALACAHPTVRARDDSSDGAAATSWSPAVTSYYQAIGKHVATITTMPGFPGTPQCDLTKATPPTASPALPTPSAGQKLMHVAIGRGTQNYTCADSTSNSVPVSIGAKATLYNASCAAALYPDVLQMTPGVVLNYNLPSDDSDKLSPAGLDISGHHFFTDATTPAFDMNTPADSFGVCLSAKKASSPAPSGAPVGQNNQGFGAVPWLYLEAKAGSTGFKTVYRLNTAGGSAPPTCLNMGPTFEVQYAAEYWFYE